MADAATLTVAGRVHAGWTELSITRSIEQIAGAFSLVASERWPGQQAAEAVRPGQACSVAIGGDTVITGHIDQVRPDYAAGRHRVQIRGRDATGDLVDCSAIHETGEWRDRTLAEIAIDLCRPFGIAVTPQTDIGAPFRKFTIEQGETVFEAIERAARIRAVLPVTDGLGGLRLIRAGDRRAEVALERGVNILQAAARYDHRDRFSEYLVKGQQPADDFLGVAEAAQPSGRATDPGIGRYRPLIVLAEHNADLAGAGDRAAWEADVRAARSRRAEIVVRGWRQRGDDGPLWTPDTLVRVDDDALGIAQDMLIAGVTHGLDERGSRAALSCVTPGAFRLRPLPEPSESDGWLT